MSKGKQVVFRVTERQAEWLDRRAGEHDMNISDYVRWKLGIDENDLIVRVELLEGRVSQLEGNR